MRGLLSLFRRFGRDERGAFLAIFGLLAVVLVATAGAVVDYTAVETAKARAQVALDAASLALQAKIYDPNYNIQQRAQDLLIERLNEPRITATVLSADRDTSNGELTLTARLVVPLRFVNLVGIPTLEVALTSVAIRGSLDLEVAVALDITGSMAGSKITALRNATNDLIDQVVKDVQIPTYSKMAIVPYSVGVNVGSYAAAARGPIIGYTNISGASWQSGSAMTISAINKSNNARVTTSLAHGLSTGDTVYISGVTGGGFTALNNKSYTVTVLTNVRFRLDGGNSSAFNGNYSGGSGSARKCQVSDCEIVVTSASHGLNNGEAVYITSVNGMTQLNNQVWRVADVTANTYVLDGTDGPNDFSNYSSNGRSYCTQPGCQYHYFQAENGGWRLYSVTNCVTERVGANRYTDVSPATTFVGRNYPSGSGQHVCPTNQLVPLTSNKTTLHNAVNAMTNANGYTAGQIGLAWAWYAVSPTFSAGLTGLPAASVPASYDAANLLKVVILMTDGEFNTAYCNGVISGDSSSSVGSSERIDCNASNGDAFAQATSLCNAIKAEDIVVYTVAFDLGGNQNAINIMSNCASDPTKAYAADDAAALSAAFNSIAQNISALRLTH